MKIATFSEVISPEVGTLLAGYGRNDVSIGKHDDLRFTGICIDDGERRAVLIAFDLIGLSRWLVLKIRKAVAEVIGCGEAEVVLTCSHTHEGPHTRDSWTNPVNAPYSEFLVGKIVESVKRMMEKNDFTEVVPYFYSARVPVNVNRRYCGPENVCRFLPCHRELEPLGDGIVDSELGMLFFYAAQSTVDGGRPVAAIANFAAHPLLNRAPWMGGLSISADYPGLFREHVAADTGAFCVFTTGAAGNQFPKGSELGFSHLDEVARPLAAEFVRGMINARRNGKYFKLDPKVRCSSETFTVGLRKDFPAEHFSPGMQGKSEYELELQFLAIGDVCFVGVPGELEAEPGLEIKWHSPFRRTWILYNSTDYISYICPVNDFVSGGYESSHSQQIEYRGALKLVNAAVEGLFKLHGEEIDVPPYP